MPTLRGEDLDVVAQLRQVRLDVGRLVTRDAQRGLRPVGLVVRLHLVVDQPAEGSEEQRGCDQGHAPTHHAPQAARRLCAGGP